MAISMGGKSGGKKSPMSEINITPFTDVCLVLLIIFMVSASFMGTQRGLDVKLPSPSTDKQQDTRPVRDLTIDVGPEESDPNAGVTLTISDGKTTTKREEVPMASLLPRLESEATQYKVQSVTVKAERGVIYRRVVQVMDTVKEAGIDYMALAVQQVAGGGMSPVGAPGAGSPAAGAPASGTTGAPASGPTPAAPSAP